jgi:hypothetical protein
VNPILVSLAAAQSWCDILCSVGAVGRSHSTVASVSMYTTTDNQGFNTSTHAFKPANSPLVSVFLAQRVGDNDIGHKAPYALCHSVDLRTY